MHRWAEGHAATGLTDGLGGHPQNYCGPSVSQEHGATVGAFNRTSVGLKQGSRPDEGHMSTHPSGVHLHNMAHTPSGTTESQVPPTTDIASLSPSPCGAFRAWQLGQGGGGRMLVLNSPTKRRNGG